MNGVKKGVLITVAMLGIALLFVHQIWGSEFHIHDYGEPWKVIGQPELLENGLTKTTMQMEGHQLTIVRDLKGHTIDLMQDGKQLYKDGSVIVEKKKVKHDLYPNIPKGYKLQKNGTYDITEDGVVLTHIYLERLGVFNPALRDTKDRWNEWDHCIALDRDQEGYTYNLEMSLRVDPTSQQGLYWFTYFDKYKKYNPPLFRGSSQSDASVSWQGIKDAKWLEQLEIKPGENRPSENRFTAWLRWVKERLSPFWKKVKWPFVFGATAFTGATIYHNRELLENLLGSVKQKLNKK
jgi:hypothetical protein